MIHLSFPERGNLPPVKLHWYDGGLLPERPEELEPERRLPQSGTIFVGDKGKMWCETYSESPRLIPESAMQAFQRPPRTLPRVPEGRPGHEKNWLDAIRQKGQAVSHFDYAGPFTETVLLGNVALRYPGQRLLWDAANMKVTNVARRRPVRAARLSYGLVAVIVGADRKGSDPCVRPCVPIHRTSTAGSGSRNLASSATSGVSRTRPCTPCSRCTRRTPTRATRAQAAQAAFAVVDRLEGELSRFRPNSDITRVNQLAPGESARVGEAALECLSSRGTCTTSPTARSTSRSAPACRRSRSMPTTFSIRAPAGGVRVDLGGIGKGYAVDLMAELLEEWGLDRAFVHGGFSSALALEAPAGCDGWPLTLSDPREPSRVFSRLSMRQAALSASGVRKGDHILDPRTRTPVRGRLAAWVALPRPAGPGVALPTTAGSGSRRPRSRTR